MKRFMLLILCICMVLFIGCSREKPIEPDFVTEAPTPTPTPAATPTERVGEVIITAAPGSTSSPVSTPVPTGIPEASGDSAPVDISGSFRTDTGTALNMIADWECVSVSAKNVRLTIRISLESYSLSVGERSANQLVLNGVPITFRTPAIEVPSGSLSRTELYTWSETLPLMEDGSLQQDLFISWVFSGSYSGVEMEKLELSGHISVP